MGLSLRVRETLVLATIVLLVVAVATGAHLASVAQITLRAAADEGKLLTRQLFHQSARSVTASPVPALDSLRRDGSLRALLEGMVGYSRVVVYAAIADPTGRVVVHSDPGVEGQTLLPRPNLDSALAWGPLRMVVTLLGRAQIYDIELPLQLGNRPFGTVRVGISTSLVRQELVAALVRSLALGAAALVVALGVGLGAGRVLLQFCRQVALRVEQLARSGFGSAVELGHQDAMGALAERVNRLGEQIQVSPASGPSDRRWIEGAIDNLEDAVVFLNPQREWIFGNQAAERLLARRPEDLLARRLDTLLPEGHALLSVVGRLFDAGEPCRNRPLAFEGPDGQERELAVSCYLLQDGPQAGSAVLVLKDLVPIRAVQSLVTHAQKLAALGRLTSGVAHEVKNPLNAMRIHIELLRTRLSDPGPDVAENLDVIAYEIQRLDRVVQGFLRFMRPQELRLEPVDVNGLLAAVARLAGPEAAQTGVEIVRDQASGLPPVTGDAELLQQACTNLAMNGIQAMPKGGTLTLATRAAPRGGVEVRVQDQGVGIAPEDLDKIFRLYYTTKENGSGIGLALVYRIVQLHDGRIEVESAVGEGTTVILTFPLVPVRAT